MAELPILPRRNINSRIVNLTLKTLLWPATILLAVLLILFDVTINPEFAMPQDIERLDAEEEAHYLACYSERDAEIHRRAFGTIDNPDVQKEFITNNRAVAAAECRAENPRRTVMITTPLRINFIDLSPRFW